MRALPTCSVPSSIDEARAVQDALRAQVSTAYDGVEPDIIAGVDVGYDRLRNLAHASVVTMPLASLKPLESVQAFAPVEFPYVPGFLSFREIPAIIAALAKLPRMPDMLMVDGQGIAHPRRLGIAAHLGVLLDMPSIGVAKSRLVGNFKEPGLHKGASSPLMMGEERIGAVLRSREHVKPLFVSPGHRMDVDTAVRLTLQCITRCRLPEPTRVADQFSKCKTTPALL